MSATRSGAGRLATVVLVAAGEVMLLLLALGLAGRGGGQETDGKALEATGSLLETIPFDVVILTDGTELKVEPVSPRPLPSFDPSKDTTRPGREDASKKRTEKVKKENVFIDEKGKLVLVDAEEKAKQAAGGQINELNLKPIGEPNLFRVRRANIKSVRYFEDLLLEEARRLVAAGAYAQAFERILSVREKAPGWAGLKDAAQGLLYAEGTAALAERNSERGFRLLKDLHAESPAYPGLAEAFGKAYEGRILDAEEAGDYLEARRFLNELETLYPAEARVTSSRERLQGKAQALAEGAAAATEAGKKLDLLTEAMRVWPKLEGLEAVYGEAFKAMRTLEVGVTSLPTPLGPWSRTEANRRAGRLVYLPLLAGEDEDSLEGRIPGQVAAKLEILDLGRRVVVSVREGVAWSDGSGGTVSATDAARSLMRAADPVSPGYLARWDGLLEGIEVVDPLRVEVRFRRAPLRPAFWFTGAISPAWAGPDGRDPSSGAVVGNGPFVLVEAGAGDVDGGESQEGGARIEFLAREAGASDGRVERLRERVFAYGEAGVEALMRGEVSLLAGVPPALLSRLAGEKEIRVGRLKEPRLHVVAIDGRNPVFRSRMLRRALSLAIDRGKVLKEVVLGGADGVVGVPLDGAVPKGSYADATAAEEPLPHDAQLARMLVAAARKELGLGGIMLGFLVPNSPEARAAAAKLAEAWKEAGVQVNLEVRDPTELEDALWGGARFDLAYRVVSCGEPVRDVGSVVCPGYEAPESTMALGSVVSARTRELLLALEQAPEITTARELVLELDRTCRDELPLLPLWEVAEHYAWRTRLTGPVETSERVYEGIENWRIEPWYSRDPW